MSRAAYRVIPKVIPKCARSGRLDYLGRPVACTNGQGERGRVHEGRTRSNAPYHARCSLHHQHPVRLAGVGVTRCRRRQCQRADPRREFSHQTRNGPGPLRATGSLLHLASTLLLSMSAHVGELAGRGPHCRAGVPTRAGRFCLRFPGQGSNPDPCGPKPGATGCAIRDWQTARPTLSVACRSPRTRARGPPGSTSAAANRRTRGASVPARLGAAASGLHLALSFAQWRSRV
jgi:hypothetical protein